MTARVREMGKCFVVLMGENYIMFVMQTRLIQYGYQFPNFKYNRTCSKLFQTLYGI